LNPKDSLARGADNSANDDQLIENFNKRALKESFLAKKSNLSFE
jgi:hypothetical protein